MASQSLENTTVKLAISYRSPSTVSKEGVFAGCFFVDKSNISFLTAERFFFGEKTALTADSHSC